MAGHEIEVILSRQWADYLSIPVFITDREGNLVFYNEQAETILGRRFEETGAMKVAEWGTIYRPTDEQGNRIPVEELPLVRTLAQRTPAHGSFWIQNLDGKSHSISVSSFPIVGMSDGFLGAIALFWLNEDE